jgi:thiol-disulfide isomerase/thioredoxin
MKKTSDNSPREILVKPSETVQEFTQHGAESGMARGMILAVLGLAAVLLGAGALYWTMYDGARDGAQVGTVSALRQAPQFRLKEVSGQERGLSEFRGKITLVHFWASWCPPCISEMPNVLELAKQFEGRPFEIVLISLDDNWQDAQKVLPASALLKDTVSLIDPSLKVADTYGSYQFPETYLLDAEQRIVTKWVGGQDWKSVPIQRLLDKLLGFAEHPAAR